MSEPKRLSPHPLPCTPQPSASQDLHIPRSLKYQTISHQPEAQRLYNRAPPLSEHGSLARPPSAVIRDDILHHESQDTQPPSLVSHAHSLPHLVTSYLDLSSSLSRERGSGLPRSETGSTVVQHEKLWHQDSRFHRDVVSGNHSSPSRTAIRSIDGFLNDVSSVVSREDENPTTRQTMRSLLHVALAAFPLSICFSLYTLIGLVIVGLLSPFSLCFRTWPTLNTRILNFIIPPLNFQRRCIYQQPVISSSSRSSSSSRTPLSFNESMTMSRTYAADLSLIQVISTHLLAPLVALPLAACAWMMGTVWALGAVVSDEHAGDDRDEQRLAQKVVSWWAWWLNRSLEVADSDAHRTSRGRRREMVQQQGRNTFA